MLRPPTDKARRVLTLRKYQLADRGREPALDKLAATAADVLGMQFGLVTVFDAEAQQVVGNSGMELPAGPNTTYLCAAGLPVRQPLVVSDTLLDPRFCEDPLVLGPPFIRSFVCAGLVVDGELIGSLSALDTEPREITKSEVGRIKNLAELGNHLIESRLGAVLQEKSEQRLDNIIEAVPVALAVYDSRDRLVKANAKYRESFFPLHPGPLPAGISFDQLIDQIEASGMRIAISGDETDWKRRRMELRVQNAQPFEAWLSTGQWLACQEARTADGDLLSAFTDITQLKDRESALSERTELLATTLQSMDEGIAVFSSERRLVACSEAYFDLLAMPEHLRAVGTPIEEIVLYLARGGYFGPGDPTSIQQSIVRAVKSGKSMRSELKAPDGRILSVARSIKPDGRIIVTCLDVTERKQIEQMKDEFISTVSHELRTPLTSITGSIGLLLGGAGGEISARASRLVNIAHKNAQRLTKLVNDLLDIDRLETGQVEFKRELVDLNQLAAQVIEHNRPYADRFGVPLQANPAPYPVYVTGDPDRLHQVVTNLLSNAVKHSPAGKPVAINVSRGRSNARLSVVDQGPGVPEQFRPRLFRRFAQVESSDRRQTEGTGLGLAISRAIIERHDGSIGYTTNLGTGSTFFFELPAAGNPSVPFSKANPRILICEDDEILGSEMQRLLRRDGLEVDLASTISEALLLLEEKRFRALVTDLILPDGHGLDLIKEIRKRPGLQGLAVIVISAAAHEARDKMGAGALNVLDWIDKTSLDSAELSATVFKAMSVRPATRLRVLHVEDETDLREVVAVALADFADVEAAGDLETARHMLATTQYDVVVLDFGLPDGSGAALISEIASSSSASAPVVIFSATEPTPDLLARVRWALIKSQTPIEKLAGIVRNAARLGPSARKGTRT
jgi:signal transduction histidine kinase/DNA-binding response OmpR family regulator